VADDLRSANVPTTFVVPLPRTRTKLGDRSFAAAGPRHMEQSARATASIRDTHNLQKTIKDIFVF